MSKLALITALFPPPHPDPAQHAWQRAVSVYVMAIGGVLVATYVMLIWGLIPVVFSGFATAADMQLVKAQQSQMQEQARASCLARQADRTGYHRTRGATPFRASSAGQL